MPSPPPEIDIAQCREILSELVRNAERPREKLAALDRLARLNGWYQTRKEPVPQAEPQTPDLFDLPDETFRKLAQLLDPLPPNS